MRTAWILAFAVACSSADQVEQIEQGPLRLGNHDVVFQIFGYGGLAADVTIDTNPTGSLVLIGVGAKIADIQKGITDNKGNAFSLVGEIGTYTRDYPAYGTATRVNDRAMAGGTDHQFTVQVEQFGEVTMFVTEIIGAARVVDFKYEYQTNLGSTKTQTSDAVTTTGPAILLAYWWGASGPTPGEVPYTADPNNGFDVIDSVLLNHPNGQVQGALAVKSVQEAGSYDVTWTHSPAQGAHLWLVAVQGGSSGATVQTLESPGGAAAAPLELQGPAAAK
jgi:hypothetical protein